MDIGTEKKNWRHQRTPRIMTMVFELKEFYQCKHFKVHLKLKHDAHKVSNTCGDQRIAHDVIPQNSTTTQISLRVSTKTVFFREFVVEEYFEWTTI